MSRINFNDTPQAKKGKIGEDLIKKMLQDKGWITYAPENEGAHYFDILAVLKKEKVIAIDVKTKARLNKWPAQGIDIRHYEQYMNFVETTNVPFYLIFVDDKTGDIHAGELAKMNNFFYPNERIIAWPLSEMKLIGKLNDNYIAILSQYDTRTYEFNPDDFLS
jgi:hypothetical protein